MMERKLVRQGRDALTVTLPAKWLKERGLKRGSNVYIEPKGHELIIKTGQTSEYREITVDVKGEERSMIWHTIISKYIAGYDRIIVLHNSPAITQQFSKFLLGMIIEDHGAERTIVKSIISTPENDIEVIIRRVAHMFLRQSELLLHLTKKQATFDDIKQQEALIDSNIYYCMRYINKYRLQEDSYKEFLLCSTIEEAADIITLLAKHLKTTRTAEIIYEGIQSYDKYLFSSDLKKVYTALRQFKDKMPTKTFTDGLSFELAEVLYNNIGYLMERGEKE